MALNTLEIALVTSAIRARVADLAQHDDTDEAALLAAIEQDVPDAQHIVTLLVRAIGEAEGEADAIAERVAGLTERKARAKRRAETYRAALFDVMDAANQRKWKHPEFTVTLSDDRPGVTIIDADALPDAFVRIKREPDKDAIKAAIASGQHVPGTAVQNNPPILTIRTK